MKKMIEGEWEIKKNDKKGDAKVEQNKVTKFLTIVVCNKGNLS